MNVAGETALGEPEKSSGSVPSVSVPLWVLAEDNGNIGVESGYTGVIGVFASNGSTSAFHGPWKGFPSTQRVCNAGNRQSQLGSACILFLRTLMVCNLSRSPSVSGRVLMPVESAMRTRRFNKSARKTGKTRSGLDAILSSSRLAHSASTGGNAPRKLAEISSAKREL